MSVDLPIKNYALWHSSGTNYWGKNTPQIFRYTSPKCVNIPGWNRCWPEECSQALWIKFERNSSTKRKPLCEGRAHVSNCYNFYVWCAWCTRPKWNYQWCSVLWIHRKVSSSPFATFNKHSVVVMDYCSIHHIATRNSSNDWTSGCNCTLPTTLFTRF